VSYVILCPNLDLFASRARVLTVCSSAFGV